MNRVEFRKALCLLAAAALLVVASAPYFSSAHAYGQQDMQEMPVMDMSKQKPKPKPTPQKKQQTVPERKETQAMPGMDMSAP
ncbi:MAG TPA: hypothetical protein VGO69_02870, partial [Pyrinomonadaceae bacterium]|nr:hypothetical protein [Pyrinomonadaceae bacterium]